MPRPSKKEEKIIQYLRETAAKYELDFKTDDYGNVLISVPATSGYESSDGVILQAHMDMVCEKENNLEFDFYTQPIETYVDGDWMKAKGTTLGADDGIGIAMALAAAVDKRVEHGPLQLLFTRDEESGLTGAESIKPGFMNGKYLINLDSEDEGEFCIGCAGGENTLATFNFDMEPQEKGFVPLKIEIDKLKGGHSGDDINKNRYNAIKAMVRFVYSAMKKYYARLVCISGGKLHNAIPRYSTAVIAVPEKFKENVRADFNIFAAAVEDEFHVTEVEMMFTMTSFQQENIKYINRVQALSFIRALHGLHNGVLEMNQDIEGLVETSSNLAAVNQKDNIVEVMVSQRSSTESALDNIGSMIEAILSLAGAKVEFSDRYPGWKPNTNTHLLNVSVEAYNKLFDKQPIVRAIHAGLECGLFSVKYPEMEMISFGPTLREVHSPQEKLLIPTVDMSWKLLVEILKKLK